MAPWYVTGLIEGAGSFTYQHGGSQLTLVFALRAPAAARSLLEDFRRFFGGAGRIYDTGTREGRPGALLRVTRPHELLRIVEHFERYPLRGTERRAFDVWREMVHLRAAHLRTRPPAALLELAERLTGERRGP